MNNVVEKFIEQEALKLADGKDLKTKPEVDAFIKANFKTIVENAQAAMCKTGVNVMENRNNPRHVCNVMALKMWHECQHETLNNSFKFELNTL